MSGPYCYDYPRPSVTVDLAAFALDAGRLRVLLIRRKHDPFQGRWALPGGFLNIDEPVEHGARRELREETGLDAVGHLGFVNAYGDPGRDPRGRTISLAHAVVVSGAPPEPHGADDAEAAAWLDPFSVDGLAFDHDAILEDSLAWLRREVERGPGLTAFLPRAFGESDVVEVYEALRESPPELPDVVGKLLARGLARRVGKTSDRLERVEGG